MRAEVDAAAKRCDIMVGALRSWPIAAMSAFLDACLRLKDGNICIWSEIEEGVKVYNTCKEGEEFHLTEGLELYPFCQWCGQPVVVESSVSESAKP